MSEEDFRALLGDELKAAKAKGENQEHKNQILGKLSRAYEMGVNDRLCFFFKESRLPVSKTVWRAINERYPITHGASNVFDASTDERIVKTTYVC